MKTYSLGDRIPLKQWQALGLEGYPAYSFTTASDGYYVRATLTGEKRAPAKGEWYLSGARPMAYMAPNDLSTEFMICRLVVIRQKTTTNRTVVNHVPRGNIVRG